MHIRSRGQAYLQPGVWKGPPLAIARLIATVVHEATKPGTVEGDGRGADVAAGVREGEGTGEGSGGSHTLIHLASAGESCWDKLCRKDGEIQDGT